MVIEESMIGAPVVDRDGHQIGTVKEIEGSAFKVDVPLAFDYWLHFDGVLSASIDRIVMSVDSDHLDEFKLDSPEDAMPHGVRADFDRFDQRFDEREHHDVEVSSDSYGAHDRTMVGEVITGQPPEDDVIVRSGIQSRDTYDTPDVRTPVVGVSSELDRTRDEVGTPDLPPGSLSTSDRVGLAEPGNVDNGTTVESGVLRNNDVPVTGVTNWGDVSARFRRDWQSEHGTGGTWEEHEPGYHFGYEMAHDPRFHDRQWDDIENDLRTEWIAWSGRSGAMSDRSSWERVRISVRHAWDAAHGHERAA